MNIAKLPETLTKPEVEALRKAFGYFYDQGEPSSFKDQKTGIRFEKPADFIDELWKIGIPKETSIKHIGITLESWYETLSKNSETTMTGAPEYAAPSNTLTPDQLKQFQEEDLIQKEKIKQTQVESKQAVQTAIKRQQEIYAERIQRTKVAEAALKKQKLYYQVEENVVKETQEIKNLRAQAEADPEKFIKDATDQFKNNPSLKNLSPEEAKIAAEQAAVTLHDVLTENPNSPAFQAIIVNNIVSDPKLLNNVALNLEDQNVLKEIGDSLTQSKTAQFELAGQFFDLSKIKGSSINVKFFDSQEVNRKELDWSQITFQHTNSLNQQSFLLDNLKGFGEGEIRSRILLGVGSRLEGYVAKLPANSLLARTYNSEAIRLGLSSLGIVEAAPWIATEGSWIGRIAVGSGFGNVAGFIQVKTGINLGVKLAAKTGVETAVKVGTATVAKTGLAATLSTTFAALGSWAPIIGNIIGAAAGWIVGKIAEKIPWKKVKEWSAAIVGGLTGLIALPFIGLGGAIGLGLGATGIAAAFGGGLGGLTLGGVGSGITGFFGALAGATLGAIGIPILVTLIGFPVAVALILFIINSGAYVVPPGVLRNDLSGGRGGVIPTDCIGDDNVPKPIASNIKYSVDGKYAYPIAPFPAPPYSECYHWDGNKAADLFSPQSRPPIVASENGKIVNVTLNDSLGGKYIILQGTTSGDYYYHAHLCHVFVKNGDTVKVGDVIGTMDETGNGRVQHLHFAINSSPLTDTFIGGSGNMCPFQTFEQRFNLGVCNSTNYCVTP